MEILAQGRPSGNHVCSRTNAQIIPPIVGSKTKQSFLNKPFRAFTGDSQFALGVPFKDFDAFNGGIVVSCGDSVLLLDLRIRLNSKLLTKNTTRMFGKVKRLTDKGYGFIIPEDGSKDIFFHAKDVPNRLFEDLREGDEVEFETEDSDKGIKATHVTPVN